MLHVLFHVGAERFVVEVRRIAEVLPLVHWKPVPEAPPGVVGLINYHHVAVPVVDLSLLILGRPSEPRMNTRIILIGTTEPAAQAGEANAARTAGSLLGLIAERVVGTVRHAPSAFTMPKDVARTVPYLGAVLTDDRGVIQRVEVDALLSQSRFEPLVAQDAAASHAFGAGAP